MNVAIVGTGTMGRQYAESLSRIEGVRLAAVVGRTIESARRLAEPYGGRPFASFEEMVRSGTRPDVVCVALPIDLHQTFTIRAAEAGAHVVCEKPIAPSVSDAMRMIHACERNGVRLFVGHVLRFFPEYADVHHHVRAGTIGEVGVAHLKRYNLHPPSDSWFADDSKSGGVIFDLMIHDIDFIRWTIGEVRSVFAFRQKAPGVQYASATFRFADGPIANVTAMWGYPGPFTTSYEFSGRKGVIRGGNQQSRSLIVQKSRTEPQEVEGVALPKSSSTKGPYDLQLEHFLDCIRSGREPIVTAYDAVKAVEIAAAANESARTGRPVRLPTV